MILSSYVLDGETPSKKNNRIGLRSGKNIPSEKYSKWLHAKKIELFRQGIPCPPIDKPVKISFVFYHKDERTRDTDNQISSVLDLLKDSKVIKDDNWKIVREISAIAAIAETACVRVIIEGI